MLGLGTYNYGHFSREVFHDLARSSFSGPGPGVHAPDLKATTLDGETIRLSDYAGKKNVLLDLWLRHVSHDGRLHRPD